MWENSPLLNWEEAENGPGLGAQEDRYQCSWRAGVQGSRSHGSLSGLVFPCHSRSSHDKAMTP